MTATTIIKYNIFAIIVLTSKIIRQSIINDKIIVHPTINSSKKVINNISHKLFLVANLAITVAVKTTTKGNVTLKLPK